MDLDLAGDLAQLKRNLARLRKGKHGKGLGDILIEEIDWVGIILVILTIVNFIFRYKMIEKSKLSRSWSMKPLCKLFIHLFID